VPHMLHCMQELLPEYREATEAYMAAVLALGFRLLRALAFALGLPAEHFRAAFDPPMPFLRPLHYAARTSLPEQARARAAGYCRVCAARRQPVLGAARTPSPDLLCAM